MVSDACMCLCVSVCVWFCVDDAKLTRESSPPSPRRADNNDVVFVFGSVHVFACMCVWFFVYDAKPAHESSPPLPRRADNNDVAMRDGQ
jgi:hypothetical protein